MTQIELKREIENTREDLNAAIAGRMTESSILDISRIWISPIWRQGTGRAAETENREKGRESHDLQGLFLPFVFERKHTFLLRFL